MQQEQQQQQQENQKHILSQSTLKETIIIIILLKVPLVKIVFYQKQAKILIFKDRIKKVINNNNKNLFNILKPMEKLLDYFRIIPDKVKLELSLIILSFNTTLKMNLRNKIIILLSFQFPKTYKNLFRHLNNLFSLHL